MLNRPLLALPILLLTAAACGGADIASTPHAAEQTESPDDRDDSARDAEARDATTRPIDAGRRVDAGGPSTRRDAGVDASVEQIEEDAAVRDAGIPSNPREPGSPFPRSG